MVKGIGKGRANQKAVGRSNVKARLGLNNQNMSGIKKAKQPNNSIIKKIGNAGPGSKKELKLFTKHFDAISKIQPKKLSKQLQPQQRQQQQPQKNSKSKRIDTGKGIAKV